MTDWSTLTDAYGPATAIGPLLARAHQDDREIWDDLWSRLCHQGTVYEASYRALPRLTELADQWQHPNFNQPFFLATSILASNDGPAISTEVRLAHPREVAALRAVALRLLEGAQGDSDFIYVLQALAATEGDSSWGRYLDIFAEGELTVGCTGCGETLIAQLNNLPILVLGRGDSKAATKAIAASAGELSVTEFRLLDLSRQHDRTLVTTRLEEVFGAIACPVCGHVVEFASILG